MSIETLLRQAGKRAEETPEQHFAKRLTKQDAHDAVAKALELDGFNANSTKQPYQKRYEDHSKDAIAHAFMEAGEATAKMLEDLGQKAYEDGCRRQKEYNSTAASVRAKAQHQADEAIDFVEWVSSLEPKEPKKPSPTATTAADTTPSLPPRDAA